jgi:hypothetical protein
MHFRGTFRNLTAIVATKFIYIGALLDIEKANKSRLKLEPNNRIKAPYLFLYNDQSANAFSKLKTRILMLIYTYKKAFDTV